MQLEKSIILSTLKQEISQPLLVEDRQPPAWSNRASDGEYEYERVRLQQLRAERRLEEERLLELERRRQALNQPNQPVAQSQSLVAVSREKEADKTGANQTIINIHLTQPPTATIG